MAKITIQTDDGTWEDKIENIVKAEFESRERRQILIDSIVAKVVRAVRQET